MNKFFIVLLMLVVLLVACANQEAPESTDVVPSTAETVPSGFYVPDSAVEQQTQGAVSLYELNGKQYTDVLSMGSRLLLVKDGEQTELQLLTGTEGIPTGSTVLDIKLESGLYFPVNSGFVYYAKEVKQAVFLDPQLQEVQRIQLPEDIQGNPAFSADGGEVFYCLGQEICGMDTDRKISRLIKSHECVQQTLLGCYFNGTLLVCQATAEDGTEKIMYISSKTGQTLYTYEQLHELATYEDRYFALLADGTVNQVIFGKETDVPQQLNLEEGTLFPALAENGVVQYAANVDGIPSLVFYDLVSGRKTTSVLLDGISQPQSLFPDGQGNIWILAEQTEEQILLRWNLKASSVIEEEMVYTGAFYTAQSPDTEGLEACEDRASKLNKTHGVRIRIWEEATQNPGDYALEEEYQTVAINRCLDDLTAVLEEFPTKFLQNSISSRIRICIVRSVNKEATCVQYWDKDDAYIAISVGADVRDGFIRCLGYIVDSHVLGNSSQYDYWDSVNPEGFSYADTATHNATYLEGQSQAFVDASSMTSVTEDRSRLFYEAMQPDNGELFQSETMQNKLRVMCEAIRDAWRLKKKTEMYPWEQYLTESIAYIK